MTLIDFMPPRGEHSDRGPPRGRRARPRRDVDGELVLRFGYGAIVPWVTRLEDGTLRAIAGPDMVVLRTPVAIARRGPDHRRRRSRSRPGETVPFVLTYAPSHLPPPAPVDPDDGACARPRAFWRDWAGEVPICRTVVRRRSCAR